MDAEILLLLALCLWALFDLVWPQVTARQVQKRMRAGDDRFFEEQRTYRAYAILRDPRLIRLRAAVVLALGLLALILLRAH